MKKSIYSLKAFAFLGIFLLHSKFYIEWATLGVCIFFVVSGFLLTLRHDDNFKYAGWGQAIRFAWDHIKRIYPLHIITMLMVLPLDFILMLRNNTTIKGIIEMFRNIVLNILLLQSWWPDTSVNVSLNGVAWYLSSIAFCYCLFPIIRRHISTKKTTYLIITMFIVFVLQLIVSLIAVSNNITDSVYRWLTYDAPFFRLGDFYIGCVVALLVQRKDNHTYNGILLRSFFELLTVCISLIVVCWDHYSSHDTIIGRVLGNWTTLYIPIACAMVYFAYEGTGIIFGKMLMTPLLVFVGKNSSYYFLLHYVLCKWIFNVLLYFRVQFSPWIMAGGLLLATVLLGNLYCRIERKVSLSKTR